MKEFKLRTKLMGSVFQLGIVSDNEVQAKHLLQLGVKEIKRIENLLSEFLPDSETSKINHYASHRPIVIQEECFALLERSLAISTLTRGAFDISVGPLKKMYDFKNTIFEMPPKNKLKKVLRSVGYQKIKLYRGDKTIRLNQKNMHISFAAIGKGYASDKVKKMWQEAGVNSGYINASGDLNTFGTNAEGEAWKIGITNPENPSKTLLYLPLYNASVATSGDYEQHFWYQGQRFSHNINPYTGRPLTGIKSVTVSSPSAELSDALATAVYVKGIKDGIAFINQLPDTHVLIIDDKNQIHFSENIKYEALD